MEPIEEVNAKRDRLGADAARKLVDQASELYVARGKKVVHLKLNKNAPDPAELDKLILGPTGNLRAPTLRVGKKLIVGFNKEMYQQVFGV